MPVNASRNKIQTRRGHLVVHCVNAAGGQKSIDPTELALNLADYEGERADIILMQEPWVGIPPGRRMMVKAHPNYNVFSPVDNWDSDTTRPRSLAYVRKHLQAEQLRPYRTRDVTWVKVRGIMVGMECQDLSIISACRIRIALPTAMICYGGHLHPGKILPRTNPCPSFCPQLPGPPGLQD